MPLDHQLGAEGEGFRVAMSALDNGRIGVGAQALGIARAAFAEALAYAKTRRQFGRPLRDFEATRIRLSCRDGHRHPGGRASRLPRGHR